MNINNEELKFSTKFLSAGIAACTADLCTFPLDVCKVRMQIHGEFINSSTRVLSHRGVSATLVNICNAEGFRALYGGLNAGLQRQMAFASVRIGSYDTVREYYKEISNVKEGFGLLIVRICAGITTGVLAVAVAQPTDVVKIRFQADSNAYTGCFRAYREIFRTEGVSGLWKGAAPNMMRTAFINVSEVVTYDCLKHFLISHEYFKNGFACHFTAATGAGLVATVVSNPVDLVKTRYTNSRGNSFSILECVSIIMKYEGPLGFYKGSWPAFLRLSAWNILTFVFYEQILCASKRLF